MCVTHYFTGQAEAAEERAGEGEELLQRYMSHGNMTVQVDSTGKQVHVDQPNFAEDKCCTANAHLLPPLGNWLNPHIVGDGHHYIKRITDSVKVTTGNITMAAKATEFRTRLAMCFFNVAPGVYAPAEAILERFAAVKQIFQQPEALLWTDEVEKAFQLVKPHILNCLHLEPHIRPTLKDRDGKIILSRGTSTTENLWR